MLSVISCKYYIKALLVIDTVSVFLSKCPLTAVRNRFSADELQLVRGEADETLVVSSALKRFLTVVRESHFV